MKDGSNNPKLIFEEKKAVKLYLWLFYTFFIAYEILWYFILPNFTSYHKKDFPGAGLGYWYYILILSLLPISLYFLKKGNPYIVKYILFIGFSLIDVLNSLLNYMGTPQNFTSGNIVELLFVFFTPVFINKRFFWTVTLGSIGKYAIIGIVLHQSDVLSPVGIFVVLAIIASILLIRFNSYIHTLTDVYEELKQKEKLAVIGQMNTAIGHEIRNPISSLRGFIQLQKESYPNSNDYYSIMIQEVDRINLILNDLMFIGKPRALKIENANIDEIISYTISITKQQAKIHGITIDKNVPETILTIACDVNQMKQVFINLIKNAIESMSHSGIIKIMSKKMDDTKIMVTIEDEGCGISSDTLSILGTPFYSTKKDGTGLGLMITNQIIKDHNGTLKFDSTIGKGTKVEIMLPIYQ
ncbi:ATP-binding protein [Neobacillus sp. LXY-1]|uniref:ATP-binding protein n=1 Tax=Neobacillus sp. LXY-1 TaxID=3379133 RepID=UPI003EE1289A